MFVDDFNEFILRQCEPYDFLLAIEVDAMRNEGYEDCDILSSIDDLVVALEDLRKKMELEKI